MIFLLTDIDQVMENQNGNGDGPTWDYPPFPTWEETGFEWCGSNYMWGGISTYASIVSRASGLQSTPMTINENRHAYRTR